MNTPTHIIVSYALLRKKITDRKELWAVLSGGVLPDIVIYGMFFAALVFGVPQSELWNTIYFEPFWQNFIDCFNSIPILLILGTIGVLLKWRWLWLLCLSMFLHVLGDIFLHNNDAHQHFYPLSNWRLESPISYWDPDHYGWLGATIEFIILAIALYYSWKYITSTTTRVLIIIFATLFVVFSFMTPLFFGHI